MFDNCAVGFSVMPLRLCRGLLLSRSADETPPDMAEIFDQSRLKPSRGLILASIMANLGRFELDSQSVPVLVTFACQPP